MHLSGRAYHGLTNRSVLSYLNIKLFEHHAPQRAPHHQTGPQALFGELSRDRNAAKACSTGDTDAVRGPHIFQLNPWEKGVEADRPPPEIQNRGCMSQDGAYYFILPQLRKLI
jgi:hypothetical protein